MRIPELLAPAGNFDALNAAVRAGADAVYLGLDSFNARLGADNFTLSSLKEACLYAHTRGVKIYVTMNTIMVNEEVEKAYALALDAYEAGADAFIVQDIGLAAKLACSLPPEAIHVSTQMNIHSADGIVAAAELGASRVTLARELSLGEIEHLVHVGNDVGVECEIFAHGAICVCYSGQCFLSSLIGGRSANRGVCAQPCRLPYSLVASEHPDRELKSPGDFLLSPKDMCTAERMKELIATGVASLKIEGRMKSPEYVYSVVSTYRELLDDDAHALSTVQRTRLGSVFSRGFTHAYLHGDSSDNLMSYQRPNNRGQYVGRVQLVRDSEVSISYEIDLSEGDLLEAWTGKGNVRFSFPSGARVSKKAVSFKLEDPHIKVRQGDRVFRVRSAEAAFSPDMLEPRIQVVAQVDAHIGSPLRIAFSSVPAREEPVCSSEALGAPVESARTKSITAEEIIEHVGRMGNTPFALKEIHVNLDEGVGMGYSQLHNVRARALELLLEELESSVSRYHSHATAMPPCSNTGAHQNGLNIVQPSIAVWVTNPDTARAAKRTGADILYVPALNYARGGAEMQGRSVEDVAQAGYPKGSIIAIPAITHDQEGLSAEKRNKTDVWKNVADGEPVLVDSLGALERATQGNNAAHIGMHLPLVNEVSLRVASAFGAERVWLSPELSATQLSELARYTPSQVTLGVKVYGAQELMLTEHCVLSSQAGCNEECRTCKKRRVSFALKDRKDYLFPVVSDELGRSRIYNSVTLDLVHEVPALLKMGISSFLIDATFLNVEQTAQAVGRLSKALELAITSGSSISKMPNTTTGHFHRGV